MRRDTARTSGSVGAGVVNFDEKCGEESVLIVAKLCVVGMRARTSAIWAFSSVISQFFCSTRPAREMASLSLGTTKLWYLLLSQSNKTNILIVNLLTLERMFLNMCDVFACFYRS